MGDYKGPDVDAIHGNNNSEISALTQKSAIVGADFFLIENSENSNTKAYGLISDLPTGSAQDNFVRQFYADQLITTNSSGWNIGNPAPTAADSNDNDISVRLFDDTTEETVGFIVKIPTGFTNIVFTISSRAETAPGSAKVVQLQIYEREIQDNAAPTAWSGANALTDISIPANEFFQTDVDTKTLSSLGLTADKIHKFEFARNTGAGDTLVGDWALMLIQIGFS